MNLLSLRHGTSRRVAASVFAAVCTLVLSPQAVGQHADIFVGQDASGTIVVGEEDTPARVGERVFIHSFQPSLVSIDPGFAALDAGDSSLPSGIAALPGDSGLGSNALAFRPPDGERANLQIWDGDGEEVQFLPAPDGCTLEIKGLSEEQIRIDGTAVDVPGFDFVVTEPGGGVHDHMVFTLRGDDFMAGARPRDGTYLFGLELTMDGLANSDPFLIALHTPDVGPSEAELAHAWLTEYIDQFEFGSDLQAGDANQDLRFDQRDLVQVQIAAQYLTGEPATWGEGDWNGAPGGSQGQPPVGDGMFNQLDIVAAQQAGFYLSGPYTAVQTNGRHGDGRTSVVRNASTGELAVDTAAGVELTSVNIDSAVGIPTGKTAENLDGSFDHDTDDNIFNATLGSGFGSLSIGNVARPGLDEGLLPGDLTVVGSLPGGRGLGAVDLVYVPVPEPSTLASLVIGLLGSAALSRRPRRANDIFRARSNRLAVHSFRVG